MTFRLAGFISASLLAHLALLTAGVESTTPKIGGKAEALQVTLVAAAQPAARIILPQSLDTPRRPQQLAPTSQRPVTRNQHRVATKASSQPTPAPATFADAAQTPLSQPHPPAVSAASAAAPAAATRRVSEQISAALQNQLAENFSYPWLARKRGWQGSVMLSLHIGQNGHLTQWRVARTSGYQVLDRSALDSARRIHNLPAATSLLNGTALDVLVPVHYRLLDS